MSTSSIIVEPLLTDRRPQRLARCDKIFETVNKLYMYSRCRLEWVSERDRESCEAISSSIR